MSNCESQQSLVIWYNQSNKREQGTMSMYIVGYGLNESLHVFNMRSCIINLLLHCSVLQEAT